MNLIEGVDGFAWIGDPLRLNAAVNVILTLCLVVVADVAGVLDTGRVLPQKWRKIAVRFALIQIAKEGITILLASHLLDEVQKTCSHVTVLQSGKKLFEGRVNDVLNLSDTIEVASQHLPLLEQTLTGFDKIINIENSGDLLLVTMKEKASTSHLNEFLVNKGIVVSHLALRKKSLEQQFLELLSQQK